MIATSLYMPFLQVMTGHLDYNQALDLVNSTSKDPRHHESCEMIIRLYFDEFLAGWEELMKRRGQLVSVQIECRRAFERGQDVRTFVKPFDAAMVEFQEQERILRDAIISKARRLTSPNRI